PRWRRGNADRSEHLVESDRRNSNTKIVKGERADVGATEGDRWKGDTTAKQAGAFVEDKLERIGMRACPGIGKQDSWKRLAAGCQREHDLHARPTMPKRPLHAGHQNSSQISTTSV